jgi:hypothetical protein
MVLQIRVVYSFLMFGPDLFSLPTAAEASLETVIEALFLGLATQPAVRLLQLLPLQRVAASSRDTIVNGIRADVEVIVTDDLLGVVTAVRSALDTGSLRAALQAEPGFADVSVVETATFVIVMLMLAHFPDKCLRFRRTPPSSWHHAWS